MSSTKLMLISDDIELATGLTRLAMLSSRLGEWTLAREYQSDAEGCYARAESLAAGLSSPDDQKAASSSLERLRVSIVAMFGDREALAGTLYGRQCNFYENTGSLLPG
jgi:hypothetical protein